MSSNHINPYIIGFDRRDLIEVGVQRAIVIHYFRRSIRLRRENNFEHSKFEGRYWVAVTPEELHRVIKNQSIDELEQTLAYLVKEKHLTMAYYTSGPKFILKRYTLA